MSATESSYRLLTTAGAAERLGISPATLHTDRTARRRLRIPHVRVGASVWYRMEDLDAWIAAHRVEG